MIKISKRKIASIHDCCDNCDNITRFSDKDDDFILNYDTIYDIEFLNCCNQIALCEKCLNELKEKIDKILKQ
ncbi:hypothetical protein EJM73_08360 [Clostridium botulinum]|uniref:hypothetical protein n=1 Tax=Clostridium botulinum TaxID=1491 RepID=UPI001375A2E5|nr:hypothetical protein [Clostridium botulinum]NCI19912.1 hypothetical protein [Clostridium botulinum]NCI35674.1 hypothetical protein [Clostridium botulinum]NCI71807.1 hypothetical protein [Clostridium botulinum]NDI38723.1 hypothetical protein [Clostridium botulinum]